MTFEDFFIKKNIDLPALKQADTVLYDEFQKHYALMGEKSFDHTKKFWFNKLRKVYRLPEAASKQAQVQNAEAAAIPATEAPTVSAPTAKAKPAGFTPRFKAKETIKEEISEAKEALETHTSLEENVPSPIKPTGFKPRFKAGTTTTTTPGAETPEVETTPTEPIQQAPKPTGFKPRFKAGTTTTTTPTTETPEVETPPTEPIQQASKPTGFKPRFKAGTTGINKPEIQAADQEDTPTQQASLSNPKAEEDANNKLADDNGEDQVSKSPSSGTLGFKPRFKAGITKNKKSDGDSSSEN